MYRAVIVKGIRRTKLQRLLFPFLYNSIETDFQFYPEREKLTDGGGNRKENKTRFGGRRMRRSWTQSGRESWPESKRVFPLIFTGKSVYESEGNLPGGQFIRRAPYIVYRATSIDDILSFSQIELNMIEGLRSRRYFNRRNVSIRASIIMSSGTSSKLPYWINLWSIAHRPSMMMMDSGGYFLKSESYFLSHIVSTISEKIPNVSDATILNERRNFSNPFLKERGCKE